MTVVISATGLMTPQHALSNEELASAFNAYVERYNAENADAIAAGQLSALEASSAELIEKASGVQSRFVVDKQGVLDVARMAPDIAERPNEQISVMAEMGAAAAKDALSRAGRNAAEVNAVICAASNMQRPYPAIAIEIQNALGAGGYAYDMNVACASAAFGVEAAANAVRAGHARSVLVVSPEICSGHLNWRDRESYFGFGDAATAVLVERADIAPPGAWAILGLKLATQFSSAMRNNFGFLNRCAPEWAALPDKLFVQDGRKVTKEVAPMVSDLVLAHLAELQIEPSELKRMWLHQASAQMNRLIAESVLGREPDAAYAPTVLERYANTSSAGAIIAFHLHSEGLAPGDKGLICSFGAGYSAGSIVLAKAA